MTEEKKSGYTTREWILILSLIFLIQFVIQGTAFVYCGSGSALNYWSLVGTSISIVLAILAIVWSFIQNLVQQRGSDSISAQIVRLQTVVENANSYGSQFDSKLTRLEDVQKQLQETVLLARESRDGIAAVGKKMEETQKLVEELSRQPQQEEKKGKHAGSTGICTPNEFWGYSSLSGSLLMYACYLSHKNKLGFSLEELSKKTQLSNYQYLYGYMVAARAACILEYAEANNIWNITSIKYTEADNLKKKIEEKVDGIPEDNKTLKESFRKNVATVEGMFGTVHGG